MTSLERRSLSNSDLTSLRWSSECWGQFLDLRVCGKHVKLLLVSTSFISPTVGTVYGTNVINGRKIGLVKVNV